MYVPKILPCVGGRYNVSLSSPGIHMYDGKKDGSKRIVAEVRVQAQLEDVWGVLTDYEALPGFVPNLEVCERLPSAKPGVMRLRQVGCSQSILWRLEAEAELEVEEVDSSSWRKEVRFRMISGDFEELYGRWIVESNMASTAQMSTFLRYDICIQPRFSMPSQITSYIIKAGLPSNIRAIASRAESVSEARLKASGLASWIGTEVNPDIPQPEASVDNQLDDEAQLPSKGPFWPRGSPYAASAPITAERQNRLAVMDAAKSVYLGTAWVPLPPSGAPGNVSVKEALNDELQEKSSKRNPSRNNSNNGNGIPGLEDSRTAFLAGDNDSAMFSGLGDRKSMSTEDKDIEIHLRRLDGLDYLHRRSIAAIKINAPPSLVWNVLTDYNRLAEFVPNLASSERIRLPRAAPENVVRVRQIGYKNMFYMCLHAESVMDLVEKPLR